MSGPAPARSERILQGEDGGRATPEPLSRLGAVLELARDVFCGGLAGVIAGVVFLGVGSRLVMRASALLNSDAEGFLTENGNVVGEVTLGGTAALIFFGGLFGGMITGLFWVLTRDWLPRRPALRTATTAALATLVGGPILVTSTNTDFARLDPVWLHITMFLALLALTGAATALLDPRLQAWLPRGRAAGAGYAVLLAPAGLLTGAVALQGVFLGDPELGEDAPLFVSAPFALLVAASVSGWWQHLSDRAPGRPAGTVRWVGVAALGGLAAGSIVELTREIGRMT